MANVRVGDAGKRGSETVRPSMRTVASATNVCRILDCFAGRGGSLTLAHIARAVGLRPSSVHHLLKTLDRHEYVAFNAETRTYALGPAITRLLTSDHRETLSELARPYLVKLRDATGETAALQLRDGDVRYCATELPSLQPIRMELTETARYPVTLGASGDILRAFSSDWRVQPDASALRRVRRNGYAVSHGSLLRGALAVYVPVVDRSGRAIAAIGVHGPEFRMNDTDVATIVRKLKTAARELAERV